MIDWVASSEMMVMLVVLGFLLVELVSIRRTIKRDRARLEAEKRDLKP